MRRAVKRAVSVVCVLSLAIAFSGISVCAASAADARRAEYYKEYQKITKRISEEIGMEVGVLPISEFMEEDWRAPEEFEEIVWQLVNTELVVSHEEKPGTAQLSPVKSGVSALKNVSLLWGGEDPFCTTIQISASFTTQYNSGRQYISTVSDISSQATDGTGIWIHNEGDYELLDSSRTAKVAVSGVISYSGAYVSKLLGVEFYCNAAGGIS